MLVPNEREMADQTVEDYLSGRKARPGSSAKKTPPNVLKMANYKCPKPKGKSTAASESTNSQEEQRKPLVPKVAYEIEVEYFDVLFTKHIHQKAKVWDDGFLEYHVVPQKLILYQSNTKMQ